MRSRASIAGHPIHALIVPIPVGSFFLALVGDILHAVTREDPFWYKFSFTCIGIGLIFVLAAAVFGAIDYLGVKMTSKAFKIATWHALVNLTVAILYTISFVLRRGGAASWGPAMAFAVPGFALLCTSGWLGGKLAFEHRVGVMERPPDASERIERARIAS